MQDTTGVPHENAAIDPSKGHVSQQAYAYLRTAIINRHFPVGAVLAEGDISSFLGISRTPVRQALHMLLQEDLLEVGQRRQLVVRPISPERRREVFLLRTALEQVAVREACRVMPLDSMDQLHLALMRARRAAQAGDATEFIEQDERFHLGIARGANMTLLERFLEQLRAFVRMTGIDAVRGNDVRMLDVLEEHEAVLNALEARDPETACAAMRHHLEVSQQAAEAPLADPSAGV